MPNSRLQDNPLFSALLTPHRSIKGKGIRVVVAIYALLAAIPGIFFFVSGAWPVIGFLGLDALALWWAMSNSLKSGDAFEEVTLWRHALQVRHVTARGVEIVHAFNPFWVRLQIDRDLEDRVTSIRLDTRDRSLEVGAFLNPDDKAVFATSFRHALTHART